MMFPEKVLRSALIHTWSIGVLPLHLSQEKVSFGAIHFQKSLYLAINGNNMRFLEFHNRLIKLGLISTNDITKAFPDFDVNRLAEWQEKGYLKKLVNRWYLFSEIQVNEALLYRISNSLYKPSYISMESALSFYQLIPEGVYIQKAVSTRKTKSLSTPIGNFHYHAIKPKLYFGYSILHDQEYPILMAEAEKAILDYLYFTASVKKREDIISLRFNPLQYHEVITQDKLMTYASEYSSNSLDHKLRQLNKIMNNALA